MGSTSEPTGRVLVIHSAPNEPFADVIVLSPMKVILLQCKHYRSTPLGQIGFMKEFFNMGIINSREVSPSPTGHDKSKKQMNSKTKKNKKNSQRTNNNDSDPRQRQIDLRHRLFLLHLRRMCAEDPYD